MKGGLTVVGFGLLLAFVVYSFLSEAGRCDELLATTKHLLRQAQICEQDSDCEVVQLQCPLDCETPISSNQRQQFFEQLDEYYASCMMACPECPKGRPPAVRCVSNKCTIS